MTDQEIIDDFLTGFPWFTRRKDWPDIRQGVIDRYRQKEEHQKRLEIKRAKRAAKIADIYCKTDGGKSSAGIEDKNDCAVRALSVVFDLPYEFVSRKLTEFGREKGRGTHDSIIMRFAHAFGDCTSERIKPGTTVERFAREHKEGRFFVCVRSHILAAVDGVIHDTGDCSLCRVVNAERVDLKAEMTAGGVK
jgi:hypothetical protein